MNLYDVVTSMAKTICDGCEKERSDVRSVGRDSNGDPDAPDLCFVCRKEAEKGKLWDRKTKSYIYPVDKE